MVVLNQDKKETQIGRQQVLFSARYLPRHSASAGSLAIMLGGSPPIWRSNENAMRPQKYSLYSVGLEEDNSNRTFECLRRTQVK
jgi:hypothetical protein